MHFPAPGRDNTPFLLEITNIPSSFSLGQPPHQFHQPTCFCATYLEFIQLQRKKCACSSLQHTSTQALNRSHLKILKTFTLAITDFLSYITFFSLSRVISIYMLSPILERQLLLTPLSLQLPLNFLAPLLVLQTYPYCCLHSFISFLTFSYCPIYFPRSFLSNQVFVPTMPSNGVLTRITSGVPPAKVSGRFLAPIILDLPAALAQPTTCQACV